MHLFQRKCRVSIYSIFKVFRIKEDLIKKWVENVRKFELFPGGFVIVNSSMGMELSLVDEQDKEELSKRKENQAWVTEWKVKELVNEISKQNKVDTENNLHYLTKKEALINLAVNAAQLSVIVELGVKSKSITLLEIRNELRIFSAIK